MKRTTALALATSLVLSGSLSGCQAETWLRFLDDNPVSERVFWAGLMAGAAPPTLAGAPLTVPLSLAFPHSCSWLPIYVGLPTGAALGITLGVPTLIVESLLRYPSRGGDDSSESELEPAWEDPVPADPEEHYGDWPRAAEAPR